MLNLKASILMACVFACSSALQAAIYQSVDEQGNVVYSDEPGVDAKPVQLPELPTYQAPKYKTPSRRTGDTESETGTYNSLTIQQPAPDETLRDNTGQVAVSVSVDPALDEGAGHRIQFYLDGQPMGEPAAATQGSFTSVDRGAHDVEAAVLDASGQQLIRSDSVRFYLHRHSVNFPSGPGTPSPAPVPRPLPTRPIAPR